MGRQPAAHAARGGRASSRWCLAASSARACPALPFTRARSASAKAFHCGSCASVMPSSAFRAATRPSIIAPGIMPGRAMGCPVRLHHLHHALHHLGHALHHAHHRRHAAAAAIMPGPSCPGPSCPAHHAAAHHAATHHAGTHHARLILVVVLVLRRHAALRGGQRRRGGLCVVMDGLVLRGSARWQNRRRRRGRLPRSRRCGTGSSRFSLFQAALS